MHDPAAAPAGGPGSGPGSPGKAAGCHGGQYGRAGAADHPGAGEGSPGDRGFPDAAPGGCGSWTADRGKSSGGPHGAPGICRQSGGGRSTPPSHPEAERYPGETVPETDFRDLCAPHPRVHRLRPPHRDPEHGPASGSGPGRPRLLPDPGAGGQHCVLGDELVRRLERGQRVRRFAGSGRRSGGPDQPSGPGGGEPVRTASDPRPGRGGGCAAGGSLGRPVGTETPGNHPGGFGPFPDSFPGVGDHGFRHPVFLPAPGGMAGGRHRLCGYRGCGPREVL